MWSAWLVVLPPKRRSPRPWGRALDRSSDARWKSCAVRAGEPVLRLHGKAQVIAAALKLTTWSVSISDTHTQAAAVAIALGEKG